MNPGAQSQSPPEQHNEIFSKKKPNRAGRTGGLNLQHIGALNPRPFQVDEEQEIILFPTLPSSDGSRQGLLPSQVAFLPHNFSGTTYY